MAAPIDMGLIAAFGLLVISGVLVTLTVDWRLALVAAAGQYVALGMLLRTVAPDILAYLYILVGGLACLILYLGRRAQGRGGAEAHIGTAFRAVALLLALLLAGIASILWPLPFATEFISLACFTLAALFVAQVTLFQEPMRAGLGVLFLLSGLVLYEQSAEGSLLLVAWAAVGHLLVSLAAGHLQSFRPRTESPEEKQ